MVRPALMVVLVLLFGLAGLIGASPQGLEQAKAFSDRDCSDFSSQRDAQRFFEDHNPGEDPHRLDADGDGEACETLPCPCGSGGGDGGDDDGPARDDTDRARVAAVIDGDTLRVRSDGETSDVRLIGIDTPEVFGGTECGGEKASRSMRRLVDPGDRVVLIRDRSQDNKDGFGRLLRYVERQDQDVGKKQIDRGWAKVVKFDGSFERISRYRDAEDDARRDDEGVWGECGGDFHRPT